MQLTPNAVAVVFFDPMDLITEYAIAVKIMHSPLGSATARYNERKKWEKWRFQYIENGVERSRIV